LRRKVGSAVGTTLEELVRCDERKVTGKMLPAKDFRILVYRQSKGVDHYENGPQKYLGDRLETDHMIRRSAPQREPAGVVG